MLGPADEVPGKAQAALLSYNFWRRQFGGDRNIVGRRLFLDREPVVVAGVMPPAFDFPGCLLTPQLSISTRYGKCSHVQPL